MLNTLKRILVPPILDGDDEQTSRERIANTLIVYLGAALLLTMFVFIPAFAVQKIGSWILVGTIFCALAVGRFLIFKRRWQLGSILISSVLFLSILAMFVFSGGSPNAVMFYLAAAVLIAGFFLDARVANWLTILILLIVGGIAFLQAQGLIVVPKIFDFTSTFSWIATALGFILMISARDLFVGSLRGAIARARQKNLALQEAEVTLSRSEAHFRAIVEHAYEGIIFMDAGQKITYASPASTRISGYAPQELVGKAAVWFVHPDDQEAVAQEFQALMLTPNAAVTSQYRIQHKDGSWRWIEATAHNLLADPAVQSVVLNNHDISERKISEQAVRESEEKFRRMLETTNEGVIVLDRDDRMTLVNQQMATMLGYSIEELLHQKLEFLLFEEDMEDYRVQMQQRMRGQNAVYERSYRQKDGGKLSTIISVTVLTGADGQYDGSFGMITDITERKQAERALKSSEEKFAKAFRMNPSAVTLTRLKDAVVVDVNDTFTQVFGYKRDEIVGTSTLDIGFWEDIQERQRLLSLLLSRSSLVGVEVLFRSKDRRLITCSASFEEIEIEGEQHVLAVVEDITERKAAELKQRESHQRLNRILENLQDAYFQADRAGNFTFVNPAAVTMYRFSSSEEMIGKPAISLYANQQDRETMINELRQSGRISDWSCQARRKDGTTFWASLNVQFVYDEGGQIIGTEGVVRDISERRQAEKALRVNNALLTQFVSHSPIYCYIKEVDSMRSLVLQASDNFEDMVGIPGSKMVGHTMADLYPPDFAEKITADDWAVVSAGKVLRLEEELNGRSYETIKFPIPLEEKTLLAGYTIDITERKRTDEAIRQRNAELTALSQIGQSLGKLAEPADILERIFTEIGKVLDNRNLFIALYDKENQYISFPVYTMDGERVSGRGRPLADGVTDYIIRNNQPFWVTKEMSEALQDSGITLRGKLSRSFIGVPIHQEDEVIGVIALQDYEHENVYNEHHLELLTTIAAQASSSLENARLYHAVQQELDERKRTETALFEAQELTNSIVESTPDLIWSVDPDTFGLLTFNHGLRDYFLDGRGIHIQTGMRPEDLFPPGEYVGQWQGFYRRALSEGPFVVEYKTYSGLKILQLTFNLLRRDGHVFGVSVFGKDITERKHAEEQLRESEMRFRSIIENAPIAISIGRDGKLLYTNPAYVRWHGFTSADELIGSPTVERVAAQHREATIERARLRAADQFLEETPYELMGLRRDGTEFPMIVAVSRVNLADGPANIGFFQDITDRKEAEEALRESEAHFREVLENSLDAPYKRNLKTNTYDYLSSAFAKISGYTPEEFVNLPVETVLELVHPEDRANGSRLITESMLGADGSSYFWDYRFKHRDGQYRWLHDQFILLRDEQGQPSAWIGSVSDITERKQRENELQVIAILSTELRSAAARAEMLPLIVKNLVPLLQCDAVSAEVIDAVTNETIVEAAYGQWESLVGFRQPDNTGLNRLIRETRRPYHNNDFDDLVKHTIPEFAASTIRAVAGVPLIAQDELVGILWMGRKTEISQSEVRLLAAVADMTANALHRAALHERTQKFAVDLTHAYDTTLEGWAYALELRDQETEGHSRNVVHMTVEMARQMGFAGDELEHIRRGALLHDIGKMGIPDSVLRKPGTLDEREWEIMRMHPDYAYKLLAPIEYLRPVLDIPYCHHEKWDGSGYPRGLQGEDIPLAARLFAIVDVWDALRTKRPYRDAWSYEKARAYILSQSGSHFDPQVVRLFFETMDKKQ